MRSRVASLMEEMHHRFYRSGYSTIVRESRDFSCVVLDPAGRLLVAPPMFLHGPVYHHLAARILALYGAAGLKDGDVILCNHPYEGQLPHAPDMAVVAPIRFAGRLVGFAGSIAHKADIGGAVPGSLSGQATEIFQEGLLLPPVKLYDEGRRNAGLERLIAANSRAPALVLGDLEAQVGVMRLGAEGVKALCRSHGAAALEAAFAAIFGAAVASFRAALQRLPHGRAEAEGFLDSDGVTTGAPVRLAVAVTIDADGIALDFTGCAAMTRGPVNLRPALVEACAYYALIAFLDPDLPYNDGLAAVVRFRYPRDLVVNAAPPAPVGSYIMTCHKLVDVMLKALGRLDPARAIAESGGTGGAITLTWKDRMPDGNFHHYEIHGSAYGATAQGDGASGLTVHLANIHTTPIEIIESEFPCRIARFELIPDFGRRRAMARRIELPPRIPGRRGGEPHLPRRPRPLPARGDSRWPAGARQPPRPRPRRAGARTRSRPGRACGRRQLHDRRGGWRRRRPARSARPGAARGRSQGRLCRRGQRPRRALLTGTGRGI